MEAMHPEELQSMFYSIHMPVFGESRERRREHIEGRVENTDLSLFDRLTDEKKTTEGVP